MAAKLWHHTFRVADPSKLFCSEGFFLPTVRYHCRGLGDIPPPTTTEMPMLSGKAPATAIHSACLLASPALLYPVDLSPATRDSSRPHCPPDMHGHQRLPSCQAWTRHPCLRGVTYQPVVLVKCGVPTGAPLGLLPSDAT